MNVLPLEMEIAAFVIFLCVACALITVLSVGLGMSWLFKRPADTVDPSPPSDELRENLYQQEKLTAILWEYLDDAEVEEVRAQLAELDPGISAEVIDCP